jgi:tetratricopeptide (TPR) repeat protein
MALAATNQLDAAEREREALAALVADPSLKGQTTLSTNSGFAILRIAPEVVAGEIAGRRQQWDTAILHLDRAVRYEDGLNYQEPPDWHAPVRLNLAAVLMAAGRADEAEAVYWEDLKKNPENGWSLFGLMQALQAQGKNDEAAQIQLRFEKAWRDADFKLTSAPPATRESRR